MTSPLPFLRRLMRTCSAIWASGSPVASVRAQAFLAAPSPRFPFVLMMGWLLWLTGCTLGPTVETRYVIVHPGQPLRVMENATVSGERMDGAGVTTQDVGGWIMMPPDHWAVIDKLIRAAPAAAVQPLAK